MWERKFINYGSGGPGNKGHLRGYTGTHEVDFREQIGIYVLFDKDFAPIYIGQAGRGAKRLLNRLNEHEVDHMWNRWVYFSWFGFRRANNNETLSKFDDVEKLFKATGSLLLNEVEGALITALEPKMNKQGARWKDVDEYFQTRDPAVEEATVGDLIEKFDGLESRLESVRKLVSSKKKKVLKKAKKQKKKKAKRA
jgi:hypothetical protein